MNSGFCPSVIESRADVSVSFPPASFRVGTDERRSPGLPDGQSLVVRRVRASARDFLLWTEVAGGVQHRDPLGTVTLRVNRRLQLHFAERLAP